MKNEEEEKGEEEDELIKIKRNVGRRERERERDTHRVSTSETMSAKKIQLLSFDRIRRCWRLARNFE